MALEDVVPTREEVETALKKVAAKKIAARPNDAERAAVRARNDQRRAEVSAMLASKNLSAPSRNKILSDLSSYSSWERETETSVSREV